MSADDVDWLIDALQKDGGAPAVAALWRFDRELGNPPITVEHKTAILGLPDRHRDGNLDELRAVLLQQKELAGAGRDHLASPHVFAIVRVYPV